MTPSSRPLSGSSGFALVEAIASLTVLAMAALLLMQGVSVGRRVWEGSGRASNDGQSIESAQERVRERLAHAFPETGTDASTPYVRFQGKPDGIVFLTTPPKEMPGAGIRAQGLVLTAAGDLVLTSTQPVAGEAKAPVETATVLTQARGLDIAYFGAAAPDGVARWRSSWVNQTSLPSLVRIRLEFAPGDRRRWPDLMVHPAPTIDSACLLQVGSGRCRGAV